MGPNGQPIESSHLADATGVGEYIGNVTQSGGAYITGALEDTSYRNEMSVTDPHYNGPGRDTPMLVGQAVETIVGVSIGSIAIRGGARIFGADSVLPLNSALIAKIQAHIASYPKVIDPRTSRPIPFPSGITRYVPKEKRTLWNETTRGAFIAEWYERGYSTPLGGWSEYDIHHIQPLEYGGNNDFWNLVPVARSTHQTTLNPFWAQFGD